jgi:hypothetical protein
MVHLPNWSLLTKGNYIPSGSNNTTFFSSVVFQSTNYLGSRPASCFLTGVQVIRLAFYRSLGIAGFFPVGNDMHVDGRGFAQEAVHSGQIKQPV